MTYYRIKQYCIKNGLPAGKAEYVRKMILRLVQQKVAEGNTNVLRTGLPKLSRSQINRLVALTPFTPMNQEDMPGVTVGTIRKMHKQLIAAAKPYVPEPTEQCARCGATYLAHQELESPACGNFKSAGPA